MVETGIQRMRIAVVIPKYGLLGGAEGFAYELTERLAVRPLFEFHVFANRYRRGKAPVTFHQVPILPFPRFMRQISFAWFTKKAIRRKGFDLVHSHDRIFQMDLLTMHGIPHERWAREVRRKRLSLFDRALGWVEKRGLADPALRMVLPVSELVKEELLKTYRIPEDRIRVIHPGIAAERFASLSRDACRRDVRQRHNLTESDLVVLFVGMNFEIKRLDLVMEGMAQLIREESKASPLRLMVVGKGEVGRYRALARRLGLGERVVFAGATREVEPYYMASDIFAMPSVQDTFGMAVLEAMAAGLPVIITRNVGAQDLVEDGVEGFILGKNPHPSELAEKMALLLNPDRRRKMGGQARKTAFQHTWDRVAEEMETIYRLNR